jgi:hypothetical protein
MIYKIEELFNPTAVNEGDYPLNISLRLVDLNKDNVKGPGIYLIGFKKELIYVGKFESKNKGDVRADRIRRHLEGMTLRGSQCGFNKECSNFVLNEKKMLRILNKSDKFAQRIVENKKTGAMTSPNKLRLALDNMESFMNKNISDIFKDFQIAYVPFKQSNKVDVIEKEMILLFNPKCNKEYHSDKNSSTFIKAYKQLSSYSK